MRDEERSPTDGGAPWTSASVPPSAPQSALVFRNVVVSSRGRDPSTQPGLTARALSRVGRAVVRDAAFTALQGADGRLSAGEMTLVCGPPGCGKSSLLRALAGRLHPTEDMLSGDMALGGGVYLDASAPSHSRRVVYVPPDDLSHTPQMTVRETFDFAAKCCGKNSTEATATVLEAFGLTRVADTVVGGAELRGVSGGQKRRVTVGEMAFASDASFYCLDNITNGLDSATAFKVVDLVGRACRKGSKAAALSLLQPPQEVFDLFSTVLCLTQSGEMAFFGEASAAVSYFERLTGTRRPSGVTSPEFIQSVLSGLTPVVKSDYPTAAVASSEEELKSKRSPEENPLTKAWRDSKEARELDRLISETMGDSSRGDDDDPSPREFRLSYWEQLKLCMERQRLVVLRNEMTVRRPIVAILFGLVTGTLFYQLPNSLMGTVTASGLLFLSLFLTLMLSAAVVLPQNFRQRIVFFKHRNAGFYSTPVFYISMWIWDLPLAFLEAFLLSIITYFLAGLRPGADHYFYYFGILVATEFVGQAFGRFMSAACPSEVMANVLTTAYIFTCGLVSGYMPSYGGLGWAKFLNWLSPVSYGFEGIAINQFSGTDIEIFVSVDPDTAEARDVTIPGTDFIELTWNIPRIPYDDAPPGMNSPPELKAFDMAMMFLFALVLDIAACYLLGVSRRRYGPRARRIQHEVYTHEKILSSPAPASESPSGAAQPASVGDVVAAPQTSPQDEHSGGGILLTASKLVYEVDVPRTADDYEGEELAASAAGAPQGDGKESDELDNEIGSPNLPSIDSDSSSSSSDGSGRGMLPETNDTYGQRRDLTIQRGLTYILNRSRMGASHAKSKIQNKVASSSSRALSGGNTKRLRLLDEVTVAFEGGEMTALMGESGAGKTTLLDVIAGYKTGGHIYGDIQINGRPKDPQLWQRVSGYCEQSDIHNPYLSIRESLEFGANCRMPASVTSLERSATIERVIDLMELRKYENMVVGVEAKDEGLPKHARKRLTIALELIAGPRILFLDEPTTGLDGISAHLVMKSVRQSCDSLGVAAVCTIHQPSRSLFEIFDNLLLLKRGGKTVYLGPIGPHSERVISYFSSLHPKITYKEGDNPADFSLSVLDNPLAADLDLPAKYSASPLALQVLEKCGAGTAAGAGAGARVSKMDGEEGGLLPRAYSLPPLEPKPGFLSQLRLVTKRQFTSLLRNEGYSNTRIAWSLYCGLLLGFIFFQLGNSLLSAVLSIGAIFFAVYTSTAAMQSSVVPMVSERAIVYREISSGTYSHFAYAFGQILADIPWHLLSACLFFLMYPLVGFKNDNGEAGYFLLTIFAVYWVLPSIGQLFAALSPNVESANGLAGLAAILSSMTMGFLMPYSLMPRGWQWSYWVNVLRYVLQGLCINELSGSTYFIDLSPVLDLVRDQIGNAASIILPPGGVDPSDLAERLNESLSDLRYTFTSAIETAVSESLIGCLARYDCTESITRAIRCYNNFCEDEFAQTGDNLSVLRECIDDGNSAVGCVVAGTIPPDVIDTAERLRRLAEVLPVAVEGITGAIGTIVDIAPNFPVKGDLILYFFGWAEAEVSGQGSLSISATTKWYYCLFAIFMFLVSIEIMKVFSLRYVCWIKR